jgi:hypothetical protein
VWSQLHACAHYAHVVSDSVAVGDRVAYVHTFWSGIDSTTARLIFHSVVVHAQSPDLVWGWTTEGAARAGHQAVCRWLRAGGPMPAGMLHPVTGNATYRRARGQSVYPAPKGRP